MTDDSPDAFHEQPGRETPPYGRGYSDGFQATVRQLAALRREREAEAEQERQDMVEFTPEKIRAACREIQKEWTRQERAKRAGIYGRVPGLLTVPEAKVVEGFA